MVQKLQGDKEGEKSSVEPQGWSRWPCQWWKLLPTLPCASLSFYKLFPSFILYSKLVDPALI